MSHPRPARPVRPGCPSKPSLDGLEERWAAAWEEAGTYRFDPTATRAEVFSIDTPPPTVSGSLHMGSVFGYVQTDAIARYRRMRGWRSSTRWAGTTTGCRPSGGSRTTTACAATPRSPTTPTSRPPRSRARDDIAVSRPNFIELCDELTAEDEQAFEELWRRVGLSVDWTRTYTTIGDRARRASQRMFLRNLARGEAYPSEAPTMWDVDFQTAVAQAEMEDRERPGAYHRLALRRHRDRDDAPRAAGGLRGPGGPPRRRALRRPLRHHRAHARCSACEVPVLAHRLAEPDKGSGIAMICTFGDITDVIWWRELDLPTRSIVGRDGGRIAETPAARRARRRAAWRAIAGKTVKQAQRAMVELLAASGSWSASPAPSPTRSSSTSGATGRSRS